VSKKQWGRGNVVKRGNIWHIYYSRGGQRFWESSHSDKKQDALDLLAQRQAEAAAGYTGVSASKIRLSALFEMVVDDYIQEGKRDLYIVKKRIAAHLTKKLGHVRAADFGTDGAQRYIKSRRAEGASNATINRELAIVRRGFKLAYRWDPPKVMRVPHIPLLPEDNTRDGFIEHDDYVRLRDQLQRARLALVIGYHLGIRKGELLKLQWSMVDFAAGEIRVPAKNAKNKRHRVLPIYGEMREFMLIAKADRDANHPKCKWVVSDHGEQIRDFRGEWAAATQAVGMDGLLFHDLRRSAVRNMVRSGISEKVAMEISGHLTRSVFDRYNIVSARDVKEAGRKMEAHQQTQAQERPQRAAERVN
jgi:integrase